MVIFSESFLNSKVTGLMIHTLTESVKAVLKYKVLS